jgi:hypothetical protein
VTTAPIVSAAQEQAKAPAAAEQALPTKPVLIAAVPARTISIDGDYSDWEGLQPAFVDEVGDNQQAFPGSDIKEVYLAKDPKYIYVHFSMSGGGLPSSPSGFMWAQVQLELGNGEYLNLSTVYKNEWIARVEIWSRSTGTTPLGQGAVRRRGNGFEARFPIGTLYKRIQPGTEYRSAGKIGIARGNTITDLDWSPFRVISY